MRRVIRFLRRNKIYDTVPNDIFRFSKALCGLIGVDRPVAILIDDEITEGKCAIYDPDMDIIFIKKGYREGKLSVLDSMIYAISYGLNDKKRRFISPEEIKKQENRKKEIYRIATEIENPKERWKHFDKALFPGENMIK